MADAPDPVAGLVDIPLPALPSLWPQTWESRVAVALLIVGLGAGMAWLLHRWRANRYRRAALAELARIEDGAAAASPLEVAAALAALVRRTALAAWPRDQVAPLTGAAWLAFLERTGGAFSEGEGRALALAAYRPTPADPRPLIGLVRHWIKTHRREPP